MTEYWQNRVIVWKQNLCRSIIMYLINLKFICFQWHDELCRESTLLRESDWEWRRKIDRSVLRLVTMMTMYPAKVIYVQWHAGPWHQTLLLATGQGETNWNNSINKCIHDIHTTRHNMASLVTTTVQWRRVW